MHVVAYRTKGKHLLQRASLDSNVIYTVSEEKVNSSYRPISCHHNIWHYNNQVIHELTDNGIEIMTDLG